MIKIKYTTTSLTITGHAGYENPGKDIVCAGVSAIILGAIKWFKPQDIELTQTKNKLIVKLNNTKPENMMKLDLIVTQLKPIAKKYKKYIKISKGR